MMWRYFGKDGLISSKAPLEQAYLTYIEVHQVAGRRWLGGGKTTTYTINNQVIHTPV